MKQLLLLKQLLLHSVLVIMVMTPLDLTAQQPYFELKNVDNEWVTYEDLKGEKLTVVDFWATWCQPCLRSIPELNDIYLETRDQGVSFIGISVDGPRNQAKLKPFVNSMDMDYPVVRDINSDVMSEMNVYAVPTLLVIDTGGDVVYIHEGYRPGDDQFIRKKIEEHL